MFIYLSSKSPNLYGGSDLQSCQSPRFLPSTCSTISRMLPLFTWSKMPLCGQLKIDYYEGKRKNCFEDNQSPALKHETKGIKKQSHSVWEMKEFVIYSSEQFLKQPFWVQCVRCQQPMFLHKDMFPCQAFCLSWMTQHTSYINAVVLIAVEFFQTIWAIFIIFKGRAEAPTTEDVATFCRVSVSPTQFSLRVPIHTNLTSDITRYCAT